MHGGRRRSCRSHCFESKVPFDLVLLDVMMPGPDGFETLEAIRRFSQVPVIMLTARNEEYDKLNGFRLGVDDYVAKPFSPKELMARIGAVLRRTQSITSAPVTNELAFGGLSIFPDSRIVTLDEKRSLCRPRNLTCFTSWRRTSTLS